MAGDWKTYLSIMDCTIGGGLLYVIEAFIPNAPHVNLIDMKYLPLSFLMGMFAGFLYSALGVIVLYLVFSRRWKDGWMSYFLSDILLIFFGFTIYSFLSILSPVIYPAARYGHLEYYLNVFIPEVLAVLPMGVLGTGFRFLLVEKLGLKWSFLSCR
ncbi:hypothetical protein B6U74_03975 [Candidatus Bathyarchaeota archaeon ex4484_205]|nr:MAG: hypothetical protein B6U74_03975 [Candidatus Bathyarchaeota archaeon ex4484_205]